MLNTILSVRIVSKQYGKHPHYVKALKSISLDIHQGEIISLLGVNGAGKTTLSSLIATLYPPTSGEILWNNKPIHTNILEYRSIIGYCPQKPNLNNSLTVEQNLRLAGSYYDMNPQEIENAYQYVVKTYELAGYLDRLPATLSGGYRQRVMIARALMHNPKIVVLDEPTVGLDPHIRRQLWDSIKSLKAKGVTVILTTHYLDEAETLSDRICMLDKGEILLIDTPSNLKQAHSKANLEEVFLALMKEEAPV